jgi:hypothetical protein
MKFGSIFINSACDIFDINTILILLAPRDESKAFQKQQYDNGAEN